MTMKWLEKLQNDKEFRAAFKEDSVREKLIAPLLERLGFVEKGLEKNAPLELLRSHHISRPTITGSNSKVKDLITPDYILFLNSKAHCVLDAKAPNQNINKGSKNEAQVYYYAINDALRAPFYALCNGLEFKLFGTSQGLILDYKLGEILSEGYLFEILKNYLSTEVPDLRPHYVINTKDDAWYLKKELPESISIPQKQAKARHFGCTAYFTRQSWDVVAKNITHFTSLGDVVLDPFGGSGVSAIEALMSGRQGIHTDLNPLSIFMTKALTTKINLGELWDLTQEIIEEFKRVRPKDEKEAKKLLKGAKYYPNAISEDFGEVASGALQKTLWIPKDELLPKGSDVESVLELFSPLQLAELALLRKLIFEKTAKTRDKELWEQRKRLRVSLMLGFYNTLSLINLTYHNAPKGGPASAITRYYRYRLAPKPDFLNPSEIFENKIKRVIKGKKELENSPFYEAYLSPLSGVIKDFKHNFLEPRMAKEDLARTNAFYEKTDGDKIFQADATNLKEIQKESVDFIYTDPPYGAKIPYLDLSTMWNAWLDFEIHKETREKECIEKGSLEKSRDEYKSLMVKSLKEMYRVLKFNRWLAFVFQHQDLQFWQILVEEAQKLGFEYVGSVRQSNGQTSFKKRQYSFTVLSGQLIMYFRKVKEPKHLTMVELGDDVLNLALNHIEAVIVKNDGADLETLYGEINKNALELGYLHILAKDYVDLTPFINENFDYDKESKKYHIKKGAKLKSHNIPIEKRAQYFIVSYLRSMQRQNKSVSFDDVCLECIPMMKNGVVPSEDLIRDVLEKVAIKRGDKWHLKEANVGLFAPEDLL